MPSALPEGEPAPNDGSLPASALAPLGSRPFGFYVHVPFCTVRCGYCDFNTYTAEELGGGVSRHTYVDHAVAEVRLARSVLGAADVPVATVFLGGGTPTLLPPEDLGRVVAAIDAEFGLAPGAEVTTEANPDSRRPGLPRAAAGSRLHPDLVRHAVGRPSRAGHARPDARPRAGAGCRRRRAGRRLRPDQPGPHLRHAGGDRSRLGDVRRGSSRVRARPRVGVLPDRGGGHRTRPAREAR